MRKLGNLKKAVIEIAQILAQDETICKLLVNDSNDPLNEATPSMTLNDLIDQKYICIFPPVENRIEDYGRNTFLSILLEDITFSNEDKVNSASIIIYASTNEDHILLVNNKNRLLEIVDKIAELLDNKKISVAGKLNLRTAVHTMLSEFHSAYRIRFTLSDQSTERVEI